MADVRIEAATVSVTTTAAGTSPALAEAASDPTTLALAATCPFIRDILATQDPQSISNTLAPFMALANTTNATGSFAHRARGVAQAPKRTSSEPGARPESVRELFPGGAGEGRNVVGEDWVMTDLSGAPSAAAGDDCKIGMAGKLSASADVPLVDTTAATAAEALAASAAPMATSGNPAEVASASAPPAGHEIHIQTSGEPELSEEATPAAPGKGEIAAKAKSREGAKPPEEEDVEPEKEEKPKDDHRK